jgi:outer membrane protein assembly factor BamA
MPVSREGDHFQVDLTVTVTAGPQYHVSSVNADGGPLLSGRDLSTLYGMKQGDIPGRYPLSGLESQLRAFYLHYGYADVEIRNLPVLDRDHALVSYHLDVIPGPVYHLRSLTIHNLDTTQESKARDLLGMKPGDIYLDEAVTGLYHKLAAEPLLASSGFTFSPTKDKVAAAVDLSLDFYTPSDKSSVTIK